MIAAACAAHGQAEFSVEARRNGDAVEVQAQALLDASVALVWEVISDYERLPQFVPGIKRSVVVARSGNRLTLEQSGEARFAFLAFPIEVRLDVVEWPLEWIVSRAVSGNVKRMSGRYEIHPEPAGGGVRLRYYGVIEPAFELPPILGIVALRWSIEQQFEAMVHEILRRVAARHPEK